MLLRNLSLKIAAFVLAIFLWAWVLFKEHNPLRDFPITSPISAVEIDKGLAIAGPLPVVKIRLSGFEREEGDLEHRIEANVSCKGLGPGLHNLPVQVRAPKDLTVTDVQPDRIPVTLEPLISESQPVEVNLIGEPPVGYELIQVQTSVKFVRLFGPRSRVKKVMRVLVALDLAGAVPEVPISLPLRALDNVGREMLDVTLSPPRVNVIVSMKLSVSPRTVPIILNTKGEFPPQFRLASVEIDPPTVTVIGPASRVRQVMQIYTEEFDLSGVTHDVSRELRLIAPDAINLLNNATVKVKIRVEKALPVKQTIED